MSSERSLLQFHQWHMTSPVTMGAYCDAIRRVVRPGDVIVDLGAGTGILGYQACLAGAAKVYAVEPSDIIDLVPQFAAENGLSDRIVVHKGLSFDVQLPEQVDVIIASMLDSFGIDSNLLAIVADAHQRFLKPGGAIIPQAVQLSFCPIELPEWYEKNIDCWNLGQPGLSFRPARALAVNQLWPNKITKGDLLAVPQSFDEIVLTEVSAPKAAAKGHFLIERAGEVHAIAGWFQAAMAEGILCSNSPLDPAPLPWNLVLLPIEKPTPVAPGERLDVAIRADDTIWSWDVRLCGLDGVLKAEFHHSTFFGEFLNNLRKRGPATVPALSERNQAKLAVLELCDGKRSLGEIAEAVLPRFPQRFKTKLDAQTFASGILG